MRRNLVLVHDPGYQSLEDMETIRGEIARIEPSIDTHVVFNTLENARTNRRIVSAPTLVVSFTKLKRYRPSRGRVLQGRWVGKVEQIEALIRAGVPAPRARLITPDLVPDPGEWGEIVLTKPALPLSTFGRGVTLVRTSQLRFRRPADYPEGSPGRQSPMMMQEFVDTGPLPSQYRVLTLLGVPLYSRKFARHGGEVSTDVDDEALSAMPVAAAADPRCHSERCDDADILALASRAASVFPYVPLQGIDILREAETGRLFVIELNPGGNTWHFSSKLGRPIKQGIGRMLGAGEDEAEAEAVGRAELVDQFGAFRRAAEAIAKRTLRDAH